MHSTFDSHLIVLYIIGRKYYVSSRSEKLWSANMYVCWSCYETLLGDKIIKHALRNIIPFIHSICMRRMRRFLAILRSFFHSSLLCTFSWHPSPPTILSSSLASSYHLFLGLTLSLVVPKFILNTLLGILTSSNLCTSILSHLILPSISWSTSQSCCSQINI